MPFHNEYYSFTISLSLTFNLYFISCEIAFHMIQNYLYVWMTIYSSFIHFCFAVLPFSNEVINFDTLHYIHLLLFPLFTHSLSAFLILHHLFSFLIFAS
jgi:hypothetical protein